jgi:hypothetical protein
VKKAVHGALDAKGPRDVVGSGDLLS